MQNQVPRPADPSHAVGHDARCWSCRAAIKPTGIISKGMTVLRRRFELFREQRKA
jgi:hypothetical protein